MTCLLAGLCKAALKPVNYIKLSEVIQHTNPELLDTLVIGGISLGEPLEDSLSWVWADVHFFFFAMWENSTQEVNLLN